MKSMLSYLIVLLAAFLLIGCTENMRSRNLGGTSHQMIAPQTKVLFATWKDNNLWILTRPMRADESPETYTFTEYSSFGILSGKVIIEESR